DAFPAQIWRFPTDVLHLSSRDADVLFGATAGVDTVGSELPEREQDRPPVAGPVLPVAGAHGGPPQLPELGLEFIRLSDTPYGAVVEHAHPLQVHLQVRVIGH